jgi:hypothetical protein
MPYRWTNDASLAWMIQEYEDYAKQDFKTARSSITRRAYGMRIAERMYPLFAPTLPHTEWTPEAKAKRIKVSNVLSRWNRGG